MFLSIVIPTLNEEKYLPLVLEDLTHQTNKDFEVIAIDGNSEDKTIDKARQYSDTLSLHIEKVTRRNLSFQRNYGAKLARGTYILLLDADTRLDPRFVHELSEQITKDNGKIQVYLPTILPISTKIIHKVVFAISNKILALTQRLKRPFPTQAAMIFKRDFFMSLGGYRVSSAQDAKKFFPEDHDIIHRARKTGVIAKPLSKVKVSLSLRRVENQNEIKTYATYLISGLYMTLFGKMDNSKIDYEMGGQVYNHK